MGQNICCTVIRATFFEVNDKKQQSRSRDNKYSPFTHDNGSTAQSKPKIKERKQWRDKGRKRTYHNYNQLNWFCYLTHQRPEIDR